MRERSIVAEPLWPRRGLVAGGSFCTYELKCYLLLMVRDHVAKHPDICLNIHVDDVQQLAVADQRIQVIENLERSSDDLEIGLIELELVLAHDKKGLVVNDKTLANLAQEKISRHTGSSKLAVRNLGLDFTAGKVVCHGARACARQRIKKASARRQRYRKLLGTKEAKGKLYIV